MEYEAVGVQESSDSDEEPQNNQVEAWDSQDELDFTPGLEWWQAAFSLVVVVIGVGVMALPNLPKKGGMFMSVIAMVLCGLTIREAGFAMWKGIMAASKEAKGRGENQITSYEDFGRAGMGQAGESAVAALQLLYFTGVGASFTLLIAESLEHLSSKALLTKSWLLVMYPFFAILALLPNVTAIAKLVPLAVVAIVALCSIIIFKSAMDAQRWQAWPDLDESALHKKWPGSFLDVGVVTASLFGAFGVNANVPSVLCEMKSPTQFPLAFNTALSIVGVIYLSVMVVGYYGYGEFLQSDVVNSLSSFPANQTQAFHQPFQSWTGPKGAVLKDILSACLLVKLVIGLPLNLMVVFYTFQTFKYTKHLMPVGSKRNKIMRVSIVGVAVAIASVITNFNQLFALVCSICSPNTQVLFPLCFGYKIRRDLGAKRSSCPRRTFHYAMVLVAIFTLTIGFFESLADIVRSTTR